MSLQVIYVHPEVHYSAKKKIAFTKGGDCPLKIYGLAAHEPEPQEDEPETARHVPSALWPSSLSVP